MLWEAGGGAYDITRSLHSLVMSFRPRPQPPIALVPDIYLLDRPGLIWWSTRGVKFFPVLDLICEYYISELTNTNQTEDSLSKNYFIIIQLLNYSII